MKIKLYNTLITSLILITSCNSENSFLGFGGKTIQDKIKEKIENTAVFIYENDTLLASDEIKLFYQGNDFTPLWINDTSFNEAGNELFDLIENANNYGLFSSFYCLNAIKNTKDTSLLDVEFLLTNAYFLYATHINVGFMDTISMSYAWKKDKIEFDISNDLNQIKSGASPKELILSHQPKNWEYIQLQKGLEKFINTYPLDTNHFTIPDFKADSIKCYEATKQALVGHSYLTENDSKTDSLFIQKLKDFQLMNGLKDDAVVGKWTGRMLARSNQERFFYAVVSMEKWRWKKEEDFPDTYIWVNIPAYKLKLIHNKKIIREHRVIVGAYDTQTPEFNATLKTLVTNPFWHVPYSIASTEFLGSIRKDVEYAQKKGYKIFKDGVELTASEIDWNEVKQNNFKYRVRQEGGGGNSLGRIKFLFPNEHSVFIHDTPTKYLFQNDMRAYSHGCIRLHEPFDLAKTIIEMDNYNLPADTLDAIVSRGIQRVIELKNPFEVKIEYFTATADSLGTITFHPDVYGRHEKYIQFLKKIE